VESSFTVFTDIDQNPIQTDNNPAHFDCLLWGCPPSKWTILRENLGFTIKFKFTDTVQPQAQIAANQLKSLFGILQDFILGTNVAAREPGRCPGAAMLARCTLRAKKKYNENSVLLYNSVTKHSPLWSLHASHAFSTNKPWAY